MRQSDTRYPSIADYALISDCHCAALVSCDGSIDWCCMPRIDEDSCFGRLLDWDKGGYCKVAPTAEKYDATRRYVDRTMVLETVFKTGEGEVRLYDFFARDPETASNPRFDHVRIVDGIAGEMELRVDIRPCFDYGQTIPHIRQAMEMEGIYTATGSNKGLIIDSDIVLEVIDRHALGATFRVAAGQRVRFVVQFVRPEEIDSALERGLPDDGRIDAFLENTLDWWRQWTDKIDHPAALDELTLRSTLVLKSLTFDRTGAIAAAATTSLPEAPGGARNWDYRFSWVRDSVFIVRALHHLGYTEEADAFHRFIQRSCAGNAEQMQIMYGVDGKRRLTEIELDWLEGYRGARPVRIGNRAAKQIQLDVYGSLLEMVWEWRTSGHETEADYWGFLRNVVNLVCERWQDKDHGIWEVRGLPNHYVHSKTMCWAALNRGLTLAQHNGFDAPVEHWRRTRDEIRQAVESQGYDAGRGCFVQAFGTGYLDSALLLLPRVGFVAYDDPRMLRTTDAIVEVLDQNGLLLRYNAPDGLPGMEGVFLPCTFWLVACLAYQGRHELAWAYYNRAIACANDLGLFSEEYDTTRGEMLGNFPQGLTHVSQITARLALEGGMPGVA